ncbi:hypothetical protein GCM10010404_01440 [Nonomuraea africana]|uniref:D-alanyl-D-alanine dipeptidase n=1 Tax=Nonomuraea africana TaxID=46171 RepID=A0ABR9KBU3_9ACTN|nr:hypothetical protein [Nonomuraea africana]MBE1559477.1 D-alanyl-D-alanine dipeptidase [Nonomuraea africana]
MTPNASSLTSAAERGIPRDPWTRTWPSWAPSAAAVWGVLYATVQLTWAVTGTTVPWTPSRPYSPVAQLLLALLAVVAAGACLAGARPLSRPARTAVTAVLVATVPVFVVGMISLPLHFVTLVSGSGVESATGLAHVLFNTAGAGLLTLSAVSSRRRLRGRCVRCGQPHRGLGSGPLVHPAASAASRRTQVVVYALMCGLLPWAGVKTIWTLGGDALGLTAERWHQMNADAPASAQALASVGIDITVLAALLAVFLILGLMYRWGMVFLRWTLFLSGRRVPRLLPLIPAWLTAASLSAYGIGLTVYAPLTAIGVLPRIEASGGFTSAGLTWMIEFGGLAFAGLGLGLATAARSYASRTRPVCAIGG